MKSLYWRVWLTVVAVLLLFALASGWLYQRQIAQERSRADVMVSERMAAWGELIQRSLPGADAASADQADALREWSMRLRVPLALDDAKGQRIGASPLFERRMADDTVSGARARLVPIKLDDGRTLWLLRPPMRPPGSADPRERRAMMMGRHDGPPPAGASPWWAPTAWWRAGGLLIVLPLLFIAVALGAFPVVRRLTRRLEDLKQGVERFGAGSLSHRVDASGRDEVAAVAESFNRAAGRIETLVRSHQSLLANASHELRSPLARLKMAVSLLPDASAAQRDKLTQEVHTNIAELDALVEEVLLASRLDVQADDKLVDEVDVYGLVAEAAAPVDVSVFPRQPTRLVVRGDERLLRRALRNLFENAQRYGGGDVEARVQAQDGQVEVWVCDRGPGVPEAMRTRIFEPFFRLPGHAERAGGVGLGLSLVRQIATRHAGSVRCESRDGGGSCFVLTLSLARA